MSNKKITQEKGKNKREKKRKKNEAYNKNSIQEVMQLEPACNNAQEREREMLKCHSCPFQI